MKRRPLTLYFVALVPDEPVYTAVLDLKNEVWQRFESKAALRSPPHITLHMPIQWPEEKEGLLISSLDDLAQQQQPFTVSLKDFGAFPPRVIFVAVEENDALNSIQASVQKIARSVWHIYPKSTDTRAFTPHMTIAFRDLKKARFAEAWQAFAHREFTGQFQARDICLLKHNGKSWDVLHRSPFR